MLRFLQGPSRVTINLTIVRQASWKSAHEQCLSTALKMTIGDAGRISYSDKSTQPTSPFGPAKPPSPTIRASSSSPKLELNSNSTFPSSFPTAFSLNGTGITEDGSSSSPPMIISKPKRTTKSVASKPQEKVASPNPRASPAGKAKVSQHSAEPSASTEESSAKPSSPSSATKIRAEPKPSTVKASSTAKSPTTKATTTKSTAAKATATKSTTAKATTAKATATKATTAKATTAKATTAKATTAKATTAKATTAKATATKATAKESTETKTTAKKSTATKAATKAATTKATATKTTATKATAAKSKLASPSVDESAPAASSPPETISSAPKSPVKRVAATRSTPTASETISSAPRSTVRPRSSSVSEEPVVKPSPPRSTIRTKPDNSLGNYKYYSVGEPQQASSPLMNVRDSSHRASSQNEKPASEDPVYKPSSLIRINGCPTSLERANKIQFLDSLYVFGRENRMEVIKPIPGHTTLKFPAHLLNIQQSHTGREIVDYCIKQSSHHPGTILTVVAGEGKGKTSLLLQTLAKRDFSLDYERRTHFRKTVPVYVGFGNDSYPLDFTLNPLDSTHALETRLIVSSFLSDAEHSKQFLSTWNISVQLEHILFTLRESFRSQFILLMIDDLDSHPNAPEILDRLAHAMDLFPGQLGVLVACEKATVIQDWNQSAENSRPLRFLNLAHPTNKLHLMNPHSAQSIVLSKFLRLLQRYMGNHPKSMHRAIEMFFSKLEINDIPVHRLISVLENCPPMKSTYLPDTILSLIPAALLKKPISSNQILRYSGAAPQTPQTLLGNGLLNCMGAEKLMVPEISMFSLHRMCMRLVNRPEMGWCQHVLDFVRTTFEFSRAINQSALQKSRTCGHHFEDQVLFVESIMRSMEAARLAIDIQNSEASWSDLQPPFEFWKDVEQRCGLNSGMGVYTTLNEFYRDPLLIGQQTDDLTFRVYPKSKLVRVDELFERSLLSWNPGDIIVGARDQVAAECFTLSYDLNGAPVLFVIEAKNSVPNSQNLFEPRTLLDKLRLLKKALVPYAHEISEANVVYVVHSNRKFSRSCLGVKEVDFGGRVVLLRSDVVEKFFGMFADFIEWNHVPSETIFHSMNPNR